jgi:hypothetical protein
MVVELVSVGVPAACPMSQLEEMLTVTHGAAKMRDDL